MNDQIMVWELWLGSETETTVTHSFRELLDIVSRLIGPEARASPVLRVSRSQMSKAAYEKLPNADE